MAKVRLQYTAKRLSDIVRSTFDRAKEHCEYYQLSQGDVFKSYLASSMTIFARNLPVYLYKDKILGFRMHPIKSSKRVDI